MKSTKYPLFDLERERDVPARDLEEKDPLLDLGFLPSWGSIERVRERSIERD